MSETERENEEKEEELDASDTTTTSTTAAATATTIKTIQTIFCDVLYARPAMLSHSFIHHINNHTYTFIIAEVHTANTSNSLWQPSFWDAHNLVISNRN